MAGKATLTFYDAAGKPTSMTVNTVDPTALNYGDLQAQILSLASVIQARSLSGEYQTTLSDITPEGGPDDRGGLRGTKALIRWFSADEGDGGQYGSNEIGAMDPAVFTVVGNKQVLQGTPYNAIKDAFEALARTENGNTVEVFEIELVSRGI